MTTRVAIVAPIVVQHDAISTAVRNLWRMLAAEPGFDVSVLTHVNEHPELPARIIGGVAELLQDRAFCAADVLIYAFGIYNPLFDALLVGNGHARQIVRFHNITPPELLGPEAGPVIAKSFAQLHVLSCADRIWADSEENAAMLARHGVGVGKTEVLPLAVDWPPPATLASKPKTPVKALYVGRIVPSKGLADLIDALRPEDGIALSVVGNLRFSDAPYLERCRTSARSRGLNDCVRFLGTVDSEELQELYYASHILAIPSYHEGFCKPVIEALRTGCVPVGYASSNLPAITGGLGRLVPERDVAALGSALRELATALRSGSELPLDVGPLGAADLDAAARRHVETFAFDRLAAMTVFRVRAVAGHPGRVRPQFLVLPDAEMRERPRDSLNRLPDLGDWEPGGVLSDIMRDLRQPVCIHRKSWEYALAIQGLSQLGVTRPDSIGLAVGAGSESPLFHYANSVARMVATDLYDNPQHEGTPAMLRNPQSFAPFPYREDRTRGPPHVGRRAAFPGPDLRLRVLPVVDRTFRQPGHATAQPR